MSDVLGIHSIGEFVLVVPKLEAADHFYKSFGLNVSTEGNGLAIRASEVDYRWGGVIEGQRRFLHHITFHCFDEDLERFRSRFKTMGVKLVGPPPGFDSGGLWFRDYDGLLLQIRVGPKTSPDHMSPIQPILLEPGTRNAPCRQRAPKVQLQRLSHVFNFTTSIDKTIEFYSSVLGMGLSDRSADNIAFLHGIHGSDHHMMAFGKSDRPGFHHLSWIVPSVDSVGLGAMSMADKGYSQGWGTGRHVLGSNYFHYVRDPWGAYCEYACGMDFIPAGTDWEPLDHLAENSQYLWGPDITQEFVTNCEEAAASEGRIA